MIEINENRVSELKKELQEFKKKLNDSSNVRNFDKFYNEV